jgi:hypothetical protein
LVEGTDKQWRGSPLDVAGSGMDAYGIKEIVIEFDNGDEDIFTPKQREEFESYELHQMATYLDSIGHSIRKARRTKGEDLHGIERTRKATGPTEHGVGVARIVVRYSDGRVMNFVPDAGREAFSEDDMLEMKKVLERISSTAEWAEINTRLGF